MAHQCTIGWIFVLSRLHPHYRNYPHRKTLSCQSRRKKFLSKIHHRLSGRPLLLWLLNKINNNTQQLGWTWHIAMRDTTDLFVIRYRKHNASSSEFTRRTAIRTIIDDWSPASSKTRIWNPFLRQRWAVKYSGDSTLCWLLHRNICSVSWYHNRLFVFRLHTSLCWGVPVYDNS